MMKTFWRPFLALGPDHWPSNSMTIDRQFTYTRIILSAPLNGNLFAPHPANIEQYSTTYSLFNEEMGKGTTHLATVLEIFFMLTNVSYHQFCYGNTFLLKGGYLPFFSNPFNKECNEISPCLPSTSGIVVATTTTRPEWIFYCFLFMKTRLLVNKRRYGKEAQFWSRMYVVVL